MKAVINIVLVLLGVYIATSSCQDVTVGFLQVEDASYNTDTMVVGNKADLDPDDARIKWNQPWVSNPIEGVYGTAQIYVTIKAIKTQTGDVAKMKEYLIVYGDGTLELPLEHDIPEGRYLISLNFRNEGYSKDVDDCFTVIVK